VFLTQAARLLPSGRNGRPVHVSTLLRWILRGVSTLAGPVRLEALRAGGRWFTSAEALRRFSQRVTDGRRHGGPAESPNAAPTAVDRADAELQELGF
jgi:hypothetical protein